MFFLRSAFWLTVMFVIIAPRGADLGHDLDQASKAAVSIGQKAVVEHVLAQNVLADCSSLECAGGKAALAVLAPKQLPSVDASPEASMPVPLPRPRPDRMG